MLAWHGGFGGMAQNQAHPISTTNISRGIRDHFAPYAPLVMESQVTAVTVAMPVCCLSLWEHAS